MVMRETATLAELLFHAEQFCVRAEAAAAASGEVDATEQDELQLKISHARTLLGLLEQAFDQHELSVKNADACANFRLLIIALLWVAFHARHVIDYRLFRRLVLIESSFTYLLIKGR